MDTTRSGCILRPSGAHATAGGTTGQFVSAASTAVFSRAAELPPAVHPMTAQDRRFRVARGPPEIARGMIKKIDSDRSGDSKPVAPQLRRIVRSDLKLTR